MPSLSATPASAAKRERLTAEEREGYRRSAPPSPDNFFNGQVHASRCRLFPSLAPLPSPNFSATAASASTEPTEIKRESCSSTVKVEVNADDARIAGLVARMRQMVEGVKQRQCLGRQSLNLSPRRRDAGFSILAPHAHEARSYIPNAGGLTADSHLRMHPH
ncbi:hypothetical protein FKP32DRAFT_1679930 [Trametes sanguinea]|nr:hypothetical protein FKP32DRAFT_1679930 [Trametes sanguinea]